MHDVAAVQATLMVANGLEGAPYWRGGIDGRACPELDRAIANFQTANDLAANGKLDHVGLANGRLENVMPIDFKNLRGLTGTILVIAAARGAVTARSTGIEGLALPKPFREEFVALLNTVKRSIGVTLRIGDRAAFGRGSQRLALSYDAVSLLDDKARQIPLGHGETPAMEVVVATAVWRAMGRPRHFRIGAGRPLVLIPRRKRSKLGVVRTEWPYVGDVRGSIVPTLRGAAANPRLSAVKQAADIGVVTCKHQNGKPCDHLDMLRLAG